MATVASIFVRLGADISEFQKNLDSASKKMESTGKKMQDIGKSMMKTVTAPIVGIGAGIIKTGAEFESSMSKVAAISGATGKDFEALEKQAIDLGRSTVFSAKEAAEGMEFLARAGFDAEKIMGAMPGMLDLAAASAIDLGTAADITTNIMAGFSIEASEAGRVADVLAKATASANTDVQMMGEAMKFVGPVAASLKVSMEETATAIAFMSDAGIQSGMAGRTLRAGLTRLAKPSEDAATVMEVLGFRAFDAEGNFVGLAETIRRLQKATAGMSDEQRSQAIATIFGTQAMSGFLALMDRGPDEIEAFTKSLEESGGFAAETAKIMMNNLKGAFDELTSAIEGVAIDIFKMLQPSLMAIAQGATRAVNWFASLSDETKRYIVIAAGVAAAIGPLIFGFGKLLGIFSKVTSTFSNGIGLLGKIPVPILLIIAAIGLLVAAASRMEGSWDRLIGVAQRVWNSILNVVEFAVGMIQIMWDVYGKDIVNSVVNAFNRILNFLGPVVDGILGWFENMSKESGPVFIGMARAGLGAFIFLFEKAGEFIGKIGEWWSTYGPTIIAGARFVFDGIVNLISSIVSSVITIFNWIVDNVVPIWNALVETLKPIIGGILSIVMDVVGGIIALILTYGPPIIETMTNIFTRIADFLVPILTGLVESFRWLGETIKPIWESIKQLFISLIPIIIMLWDVFSPIFAIIAVKVAWVGAKFMVFLGIVMGVLNAIIRALGPFVEAIIGVVNTIVSIVGFVLSILTGEWENAWYYLVEIAVSIWGIIRGVFMTIAGFISGFVDGIIDFFKGLWRALVGRSIIPDLVEDILSWFSNLVREAPKKIGEFVDEVVKGISELPGKLLQKGREIGSSIWNGFKEKLGIRSPSYIERAFMDMELSANRAFSNISRLAPKLQRAARIMVEPVRPYMLNTGTRVDGLGVVRTNYSEPSIVENGGVTINVENMVVRNDRDIEEIANRLFKLQQAKIRAAGGRV